MRLIYSYNVVCANQAVCASECYIEYQWWYYTICCCNVNTLSHENGDWHFYFWQVWTDFITSFTVALRDELWKKIGIFACNLLLLPCKIWWLNCVTEVLSLKRCRSFIYNKYLPEMSSSCSCIRCSEYQPSALMNALRCGLMCQWHADQLCQTFSRCHCQKILQSHQNHSRDNM